MKKKLILIGGGGHGKSLIDSIRSTKEYEIIGILDQNKNANSTVLQIPVLGGDELLSILYQQGIRYGVIGVGSLGDPEPRIRIYEALKYAGLVLPNIVDKNAVISPEVQMGEGNFIGKGAIIGAGAILGTGCIVNTGAILEHDTIIGNFVHIAPGSILCGNVRVGDNTHIGAGTTVIQSITIGSNSMIGAGSLVLTDISSNTLAYGSPAKEVGVYEQSYDYRRGRSQS
jgi:sugar O-acyltransferase (sialic acid O-acetyltransferase NeuD family)